MSTYSKVLLSGSTDGKQIKVVQTATAGTTVHTAHATAYDEVWVWCTNSDTTARKLTIEWGEATAPDGNVEVTIPPESGPVLVIPGWILTNSLVVKAFAATANVLTIAGFVNRIA